MGILQRFLGKIVGLLIDHLGTTMFVEQPRLYWVVYKDYHMEIIAFHLLESKNNALL